MDFLFDSSSKLSNNDLLQQIALLAWLKGGDAGKPILEGLTSLKVGTEIWQRLSGERTLETYRTQCIMGIVEYLKAHPKASPADIQKEVAKHIEQFAEKVKAM
ncbi:uncharacterized protein LOC141903367 [Tubulanus polymorphus]|uniref:uncharacterized protein LOC141903367 n=1 Tax=Tubulanus polymorphus TaxID=672921 RepID=UPI003DA65C37